MNNPNILKRKLLALLVVVVSLPLMVAANNLPGFLIINAGLGKQFGLKIEGLDQSQADFSVKSVKGEVLLQQKISGRDYQGIYSLELLQEGDYVFILKTNSTEIRQPVRLTKHAIQYQLTQRRVIYQPEVILKGRQLDVNLNNPTAEAFSIKLLNKNGDILYQETLAGLSEIEKRINLLQVPVGEYFLKMTSSDEQWTEVIYVR
ncbi:hypothetical protein [Lewinella sp. LCG006]|uniref:hypothetical protein n=1 Tax=Lewinella sp. LCG006 TaxID=3231911 RepID=UPI0034608AA5